MRNIIVFTDSRPPILRFGGGQPNNGTSRRYYWQTHGDLNFNYAVDSVTRRTFGVLSKWVKTANRAGFDRRATDEGRILALITKLNAREFARNRQYGESRAEFAARRAAQ